MQFRRVGPAAKGSPVEGKTIVFATIVHRRIADNDNPFAVAIPTVGEFVAEHPIADRQKGLFGGRRNTAQSAGWIVEIGGAKQPEPVGSGRYREFPAEEPFPGRDLGRGALVQPEKTGQVNRMN